MNFKVKVRRKGDLSTNLRRLRERLAPKVESALLAGANVLFAASQVWVPVETQALKDSGDVRMKKGGLEAEFIVGYGSIEFDGAAYGEDRARRPPWFYAFYVHQMYVAFLGIPLEQERDNMKRVIREEMKKK